MNKKIIGIGILFIFLLSLCMYPVSAEKENFEHLDRIAELKELKDVQHSEIKTQFDKSNYGNKIKDTKDYNDKAEVYSNNDVSTLEVWKGSDNSLKFRDAGNEHKVRDLKISYSDLAEVPGFNAGHVKLTHYNDAGIPDVSWVQHVPNDGGFGYIDDVPFSEVVIGGYVGTYSITGNVVYHDSTIFNLGATFEPDSINYISANVTPDITESGPYDIPSDGLLGFWKFDETIGTNISDSSGNGNHANSQGGMEWVSGKYNNAGKFDLLSSGATVPVSLPSDNSFSILSYVSLNRTDVSQVIISEGTSTSAATAGYHLFCADSGYIWFTVGNGTSGIGGVAQANLNPKPNTFYSIAAIYNNSDKKSRLYIDGDLKTISDGITGTFENYSNFSTRIGRLSYTDLLKLDGKVDNVILYDRVLSENEIQQIYFDSLYTTIISNSVSSDTTTGGIVSVPFTAGADITTLTTSVPTNTTIDNVTVRYYNETVTPFNITAEVGYTENATIITEELTDEYYRVYITHIPGNDYESGYVNYTSDSNDILDSPFLQTNLSSNNDNATHTLSTYDWSITTGPITQGTVYNYVLTAYLEGTIIDDVNRDGIGYTGLGAYEAEGNETTIIGSRFTAYSAKESEWGGNGSDIYIPVAGIILVSVIIIAVGFAIKGLNGIKED